LYVEALQLFLREEFLDLLKGEGFAEPNPRPMFPNPPGLLRLEPYSPGLRDRIWWGSGSNATARWAATPHLCIALALRRRVAEVAPAVDHLFRRAATDSQLQSTARDQIGCPSIFGHVGWVFVSHVDDGRADLDRVSACTNGGKQREWRTELAGEVVNAKECAVSPQFFRGNSEFHRLKQRVGRRAYLRACGFGPMPEREKAYFFRHGASIRRELHKTRRQELDTSENPTEIPIGGCNCRAHIDAGNQILIGDLL
jgi:hypothetical protein